MTGKIDYVVNVYKVRKVSTKNVKKFIRYWGKHNRRGLTVIYFLDLKNQLTVITIINEKGKPGGRPRERRMN